MVKAQTMVNDICNWSHRNCLAIHPKKSVMMILSPKTFIGPLPQVLLDGKPITYVSKAKCLGVTIDSSLSWNDHVSSITKQFSIKVKKLYQMSFLPTKSLSNIYMQGILPSATYAISVWGNCSNSHLEHLNSLHIKAARFVYRIRKSIPDSQVLSIAGWKSFELMYRHNISCLTYKLYKNQLPGNLDYC